MNFNDIFIKEKDFTARMEGEVLPFMRENLKGGYFENKEGGLLHYNYIIREDSTRAMVISHGYCEFAYKFTEIIWYFYQMGYSVFILEHRGHGYSYRLVDNMSKVHVEHFQDYVDDFDLFLHNIVIPRVKDADLYLFAHSMGGAIGALYLEQNPYVFKKAILTSPMIHMSTGNVPAIVVKAVCALSHISGFAQMYIPGQNKDYDHTYHYPKCSALSEVRYQLQYNAREQDEHYRMNTGTITWFREAVNVYKKIIKNAKNVKIPVILMQASADSLVEADGQDKFAELVDSCKLIRFEGAKHEIFNATDDIILDYYHHIFAFLG